MVGGWSMLLFQIFPEYIEETVVFNNNYIPGNENVFYGFRFLVVWQLFQFAEAIASAFAL